MSKSTPTEPFAELDAGMRRARLLFAVVMAAAMAARASGVAEMIAAVFVVPALLWAPGRGWARGWSTDPIHRELLAVAASAVALVPITAMARWTGADAWGILLGCTGIGFLGLYRHTPNARPLPAGVAPGAAAGLVLVVLAAWSWRDAVARPLEGYWFHPAVESGWEPAAAIPVTGGGFRSIETLREGARLFVPDRDHAWFMGPFTGTALIAVRGPVGTVVKVGSRSMRVSADPTEEVEEGPVPRYLDRGVAAMLVEANVARGERLAVWTSTPGTSVLYVFQDVEAVWELHGAGLLRHAHYYQILNLVEQVRWARELGVTRWVTDVQPPLWSWILAGPLTVTGGELPTANVLLAWGLLALSLAGVQAIRAWEGSSSPIALALPGAAAAIHAKLLYETGSAVMPDTWYTLATVGAVATLAATSGTVPLGLAAQLFRYPGTLLVGLACAIAGEWGRLRALLVTVGGAAVTFGIIGLLTGELSGWIATVAWETGPEHWHEETTPRVLAARIPGFYAQWLLYAGGTPVLALWSRARGTRVALGSAGLYSLLLATIDHHPPHYFLPLVALSAVALGISARGRPWLAAAGLVGLFITWTRVPVTG